MAESSQTPSILSGGEASAAPSDRRVAKEAASPWVILATVGVVLPTEASLAPGADFSVTLEAPPNITVAKIPPRLFPSETAFQHFPKVLAADASGLLLLHADQGPATGPIVVNLPGRTERKLGAFVPGYFVLDANTSSSLAIPNPEKFDDIDTVGLLPLPERDGGFLVAEFQHAIGRSKVCVRVFNSTDGSWMEHEYDNPIRDRRLPPHGSFSHNGGLWWVDLSHGLINWSPSDDQAVLKFVPLPSGKDLQERIDAWGSLEKYRCVASSAGKIRFAEMAYDDAGSGPREKVAVWTLANPDDNLWILEHEVSFVDVRNNPSYKAAGLPHGVPDLALINPDDASIVYFNFGAQVFGLNLVTLEVLGFEANKHVAPPSAYLAGRYVRPWKVPHPPCSDSLGSSEEKSSATKVTATKDPRKFAADEDLMEKFASGVSMVASLSLAVSYPTIAAAPHMFLNGYKNVLAVAVETDYSYPHADQIKEYLKDPSKFAAAEPAAAAPSGATAAAPVEEKKEESDGESDGDGLGLSLFDD